MSTNNKNGFCIYIDTVCQGPVPVEHNEAGFPVVHATVEDAERSIVEDLIERLGQYKAGERDFDDAITVEEYIVPVDVTAEGAIIDADGNCFGKSC